MASEREAVAVLPTLFVIAIVNLVRESPAVGVPVIAQVVELIVRVLGNAEAFALPLWILQELIEPAPALMEAGVIDNAVLATP
jgi:hypothetical protein